MLWVDVLAKSDPSFPQHAAGGKEVAINTCLPEDQKLMAWLWNGEGMPILKGENAVVTRLENPSEVLLHCIGLVSAGDGTGGRLSDGIVRKLKMLHDNWHGAEVSISAV